MADITYDVVIIDGSLGGVSAALSAGLHGASVCLLESTNWLGGQFTAQGVTKPDENRFIESVGSTHSYRAFRDAVRSYYLNNYRLSADGLRQPEFNPGGGYPGFSMEPLVGHKILDQLLQAEPNVHVRFGTKLTDVAMNGNAIQSITAADDTGPNRYFATYFLDGTDLGDLLYRCGSQGTDWVIGAESQNDTKEADAPPSAHAEWIQPITVPIAIEHRPNGEDHTITAPAEYAELKKEQKYRVADGSITTVFGAGDNLWNYRSVILSSNFADPEFPCDVTMINMEGNDYQAATIPTGDSDKDDAIVRRAGQASLGFLYWLQTECQREDDPTKKGYPEFKLRLDYFNTPDGTAAQPYIRESRRIKALKTIFEEELTTGGPRAALFGDSCGIGCYGAMDIHPCPGVGTPYHWIPAQPFQIPLGALVPVRLVNLLPACKNIGSTHLTNGVYRLHPCEWNIGEAAGALAAFCLKGALAPADVYGTPTLLRQFQHLLLDAGVPLYWWSDIAYGSPEFEALHLLGIHGYASGYDDMSFRPNTPFTAQDRADFDAAVGQPLPWPSDISLRGQAAQWMANYLEL